MFYIDSDNHKLILRRKSSDILVYNQVFLCNEYEQPLNLIKKKLQFNDNLNIIDGGANIGLFTVYANELFKSNFILIEPFEGNVN